MTKTRLEVSENDKWSVSELYRDVDAWQREFATSYESITSPHWPTLLSFQGRLKEGAAIVLQALEKLFSIARKLQKLYVWAHLRHDEDIAEEQYKDCYNKALAFMQDFSQEISWFDPELLSIREEDLKALLQDSSLKPYRFHLEKIIRMKPHTLSSSEEKLLAMAEKPLTVVNKTFSMLNDADLNLGIAYDSEGSERPITHALYGLYVRDQDPVLRESAFKTMLGSYKGFENTFCELIHGQVQKNIFNSRARKFSSSLEAALFPHNISRDVYHSLINAVHKFLPAHHKYMALRKRLLDLETLHFWDLYVPVTKDVDIKMDYEEAVQSVVESVAPLGKEYQEKLKKGLLQERWVDRYENRNKRSGAYSSGSYDSFPFILMNYKGILRDVFTLAHEAGHSMHSLLSNENQPFHYADYSIFIAEVASTFNEELLMRHLLKHSENREEKIFLINQKIEDIRTTLFRQVMFAEFELWVHQTVEEGGSLTPAVIKEKYSTLNALYFGDDVATDEFIEIEWARIPHFYYNFYVYQYATGISAALALTKRVLAGDEEARQSYLKFLSLGCSCHPIEALRIAGVDMESGEAVESALKIFSQLVDELDQLTRV
jgi:oligoendopeptidase F